MEMYSNGKTNAALTTGIIGTALGAINSMAGGATLLGGRPVGTNGHDHCVNRYELEETMKYQAQLNAKDLQISELRSENISDKKDIEVYKQLRSEIVAVRDSLAGQIGAINNQLSAQAVQNQANKDSFQILQERLDTNVANLGGAIERERDTRKANDNLIITYANATFVPKTVVTTSYSGGTIEPYSSQQQTYNPLPCCDCNE